MSPNTRHSLSVELSLLGFLRQGPLHGYQIYQLLSGPSGLGLIWQLKQSQLYALLTRLENEGCISAELQHQDARPTRRVYHLTESGLNAFKDWVQSPVLAPRRIRQEFLAKLFFARLEGTETAIQLVQAQRETCNRWLANMETRLPPDPEAEPDSWLVYQYRIQHVLAIIDWLDAAALKVTHLSPRLYEPVKVSSAIPSPERDG